MDITKRFHGDLLIGLGLRGLGAISSFGLTWVIARLFGAEEVGLYHPGLTTALFLGAAVSCGLDLVLVRQMGKLVEENRWGDIKATYRRCRHYTVQLGVPLVIALVAGAVPISIWVLEEPRAAPFLAIFASAVLLASLLKLGNSLLRSTGRVFASQSLEGVLYSTLALLVIIAAYLLSDSLSPLLPAMAYMGSLVVVLIINQWLVARVLAHADEGGEALVGRWDGTRIAMLQVTTQLGNWAALVFVTGELGISDAGIFRTAFQVCIALQLVNTSFGLMAGPHLAKSVAARDVPALLSQIRGAGFVGFALCSPILLAGLFFPELILGLFGPEFVAGSTALQIMLVAQVIDVALGLTGMALVMMRREQIVMIVELLAVGCGLIIMLMLMPRMGMSAASIGFLAMALVRGAGNLAGVLYEVRKLRQSV